MINSKAKLKCIICLSFLCVTYDVLMERATNKASESNCSITEGPDLSRCLFGISSFHNSFPLFAHAYPVKRAKGEVNDESLEEGRPIRTKKTHIIKSSYQVVYQSSSKGTRSESNDQMISKDISDDFPSEYYPLEDHLQQSSNAGKYVWVTRFKSVVQQYERETQTNRNARIASSIFPNFLKDAEIPKGISHTAVSTFLLAFMDKFGYNNMTVEERMDLMAIPRDTVTPEVLHNVEKLDRDITNGIRKMQYTLGIKVTGKLDNETLETMVMPRCAMEDIEPDFDGTERGSSGNFVLRGAWNKLDLTYRIINYTERVSQEEFDSTIARAISFWEDVTPLTFTRMPADSNRTDIDIYFAEGNHGDKYTFDGMGGVLAHAFYPPYEWDDHNTNSLNGDMHFDLSEKFATNGGPGIDILQTAVHELGHSLGLMHSRNKRAVMAPVYRRYDPNLQLHEDDVTGIQLLYGKPQKVTTSEVGPEITSERPTVTSAGGSETSTQPITAKETATTQSTVTEFSSTVKVHKTEDIDPRQATTCNGTRFDALTQTADGSTFAFRGPFVWKINIVGIENDYPFIISDIWEGAPSHLDAAFMKQADDAKDKLTYLIKGSKMWVYHNTTPQRNNPQTIEEVFPGMPSDIDAGFAQPRYGIYHPQSITFVKDCHLYRYSFWSMSQDRLSIVNICEKIPTLSTTVMAALTYNKRIYFFSQDDDYFRLDEKGSELVMHETVPPYPRSIDYYWLGCPVSSVGDL